MNFNINFNITIKQEQYFIYKNSINNSDINSGNNSISVNKSYNTKMTYTKDEPGMLVNYKTTIL